MYGRRGGVEYFVAQKRGKKYPFAAATESIWFARSVGDLQLRGGAE
jgi:hypothetical protein